MSMLATEILVHCLSSHTNRSTRLRVGDQKKSAQSRFLKFDPSKIKYMDVQALPLRPDLAKVGVEIRVVGYVSLVIQANS